MLARLFAIAAFCIFALAPARADGPSAAEAAEFQRIIADQIAAFNADDGDRAWSHAAPSIKQVFQTPEIFMGMVKNGYPQVYRQKSFSFEEALTDQSGRPGQKVLLIDQQGKAWVALYSMEKQEDGSWRISGCYILPAPGESV